MLYLVETAENTNDQKIFAAVSESFHMCPEELKSARSDLTEEEFRWLLRISNFDLNPNEVSDRTAREREWSLRLRNFDLSKEENNVGRLGSDKREKWMSLLWEYFLNGVDTIGSGEYVVRKPPKKPGGFCNRKTQKGHWKIFLLIGTTYFCLS